MRTIISVVLVMILTCMGFAEEIISSNETVITASENIELVEEIVTQNEVTTVNVQEEEQVAEEEGEDAGEVFKAKVTVIGKRLPSLEGVDPKKVAYKVKVTNIQDIEKETIKTLPEVLVRVEGLYRNDNTGSAVDQALGIRGFTLGEEISVFVDGVRYNEADANNIYWYYLPLENIESCELYKGADSSIYGHGGFGGTVHLYRKKFFKPYVKLEAGGLGYGAQTVGMGWQGERLYGNFVIDHKAATGFRTFDRYDLSNIDINQGISLNKAYLENLEVGYQKATGFTNYAGELTEDELNANRFQSKAGDRNRTNSEIISFKYKYRLTPEIEAKSTYAVYWRQMNYTSISRPGFLGVINRERLITDQYGYSLVSEYDWRKDLIFSNEIWSFGFEEQVMNLDNRNYALNSDWLKIAKTADSITTKGEKAYFLGYEGSILDDLTMDLGVRQDRIDFNYHSHLVAAGTYESSAFMARTHHAGLFLGNDQGGIFTSYRQAFKAPSLYELFDVTGWGMNNTDLGPELAKTSELGVRWTFLNDIQSEASVYRTVVEDEIILVSLPAAPWAQNRNQQSTLRNGVELNVGQELNKDLEWSLGYATCKARYYDTEGGALDGKAIPMVPEDNLNASIFWYFLPEYSCYLQYQRVGMQYLSWDDANDYDPMPSYQVVDLELAKEKEWGRVYLNVKNLFNEQYITRGINSYDFNSFQWVQYYNPAAPRVAIIGMKYIF